MEKLKRTDINKVISYIGVNNGYLGEFTQAKLVQFYSDNNLDIDPFDNSKYGGTTKQRFETILFEAEKDVQAIIIEAILEFYTLEYFEEKVEDEYSLLTQKDYEKKEKLHTTLIQIIDSLKGDIFNFEDLKHDKEFVKNTLDQATTLINKHSYATAVDRTHTAIHYYLKDLCKEEGITFNSDLVKIQDIWTKMKTEHPNFKIDLSDSQKPINQTVNAISKFLENMNDIRNKYVYAHPTDEILGEDEARFVINIAHAILFYIDAKTQS